MGGLSSLLVQDQVLSVTQIEQTLQRQVILGGDLPTILLELKMLDERVLVDYMSRVVGVSALSPDVYDDIDFSAADIVSKATAVACKAVPVKRGDQLIVAVSGPLTMESVQKLAQESKMAVSAQLVLEFRLALMMNQVYGVPLSGRVSTLQKKLVPDFAGVQRDVSEEKQAFERPAAVSAPTVELEAEVDEKISIEATIPRHTDATTKMYQKDKTPPRKVVVESTSPGHEDETRQAMPLRMDALAAKVRLTAPPESLADTDSDVPPAAGDDSDELVHSAVKDEAHEGADVQVKRRAKRKLISFSEASDLLDTAENRDEIIDTFFHFAHQAFDFTFLAVVHGDDASGRLAAYRGGDFNDADFVSIQLSDGGLFGLANDTAQFQIGSMDDKPGLNALNQLGLDVPLNAAVIPVVLKSRVIMLLYGDSGHHGIRSNRVERIYEFGLLVAKAFERLLLAKKYRKFSSIPPPDSRRVSKNAEAAIKVESESVSRPKRDFSGFVVPERPSVPPSERPSVRPAVAVEASSLEENVLPPVNALDEFECSETASARADDSFVEDDHVAAVEVAPQEPVRSEMGGKVTAQVPPDVAAKLARMAAERAAQSAGESPGVEASKTEAATPEVVDTPVSVASAEEAAAEQAALPEETGAQVEAPKKVSISPSVNVRRDLDADTTLKIHVESGSNKTKKREAVRRVEPIRVSKNPPAAQSPSMPPDARGTAPMKLETVAPNARSGGESASSSVTVSEPKKVTSEYKERPSVAPRPPVEHGLYMHVDKGYAKGEKVKAQETVRNYPVSRELQEQTVDMTVLVDGGSPIPLKNKAARSTAGYAELSKDDLAPTTDAPLDLVAASASETDSEPSPEPIPLQQPVSGGATSTSELESLVEKLLKGQFDEQLAEKILAGQEASIRLLIANFPGPLSCDRFQEMGKLPKIAYHGPLLRMLTMFGKKTVPFLLPLLDSFDSEIRFYTTFLFSELGGKDVLAQIVNRVFDNDRQIRMVAVDTIHQQQGTIEYREALDSIAAVLVGANTTLEKKRIAAEVFGQLHEPSAIAHLASMLGSVDGVLAERCQKALVKIAFRDFGFSERRWLAWYEEQKYTHRLEWAIEAIVDKNEDIRRMALAELRNSIGTRIDWPKPPYDFNQRRELQARVRTWWDSGGRELFPITLS
ncbi:MAG: hypothetical protein JXX29_14910 [Deltaproteobacteria bacterium]|nr:hypothetical protein [Deltaproteobacteria bacterium]MBN2672970.1 hypothetical protein [Deltaproteobacteria bacterium]